MWGFGGVEIWGASLLCLEWTLIGWRIWDFSQFRTLESGPFGYGVELQGPDLSWVDSEHSIMLNEGKERTFLFDPSVMCDSCHG